MLSIAQQSGFGIESTIVAVSRATVSGALCGTLSGIVIKG
jgi:hypothetical protein